MIPRIIVSGAALVVAALLVPGIHFHRAKTPLQAIVTIGVLALVFALVNAYIKPVLKALALPLNVLTLGLFSFVINAGLLLLVAYLANVMAERPLLNLGSYPGGALDQQAIVAAVLGSIVISAASTVMSLVTPDA
ncbi:MAG: phage holin family protein [Chloroflexota bacterium]